VDTLNKVLSSAAEIDTNATRSLRVDVKCLSQVDIRDMDELCMALEPHWSRGYRVQKGRGIELVDPCDISDIQCKIEELKTWSWVFGRTPTFNIQAGEFNIVATKGVIESVRTQSGLDLPRFNGFELNLEKSNPLWTIEFATEIERNFQKSIREEI